MQVSKEMIELADEYERGAAKMEASGYEEFGPDVIRKHRLIVAALRASAVAEPVEALRLIKDRLADLREANDILRKASWDRTKDAMRNEREIAWLIELNTLLRVPVHPAPAAPVPVRIEARPADGSQEWAEIFPSQLQWVAKAGHEVRAVESQAPAAPPREEIIEQCAKIANSFNCGVCGMDGKAADAILALTKASS